MESGRFVGTSSTSRISWPDSLRRRIHPSSVASVERLASPAGAFRTCWAYGTGVAQLPLAELGDHIDFVKPASTSSVTPSGATAMSRHRSARAGAQTG